MVSALGGQRCTVFLHEQAAKHVDVLIDGSVMQTARKDEQWLLQVTTELISYSTVDV